MSDKEKKLWNVLVYQAGDNNLSEEMVWSLQEMKKGVSISIDGELKLLDKVNVLAQYDPRGANPRRYDFTKREWDEMDGNLQECESETLEEDYLKAAVKKSQAYKRIVDSFVRSYPSISKEDKAKAEKALLQKGVRELSAQVMVEDFIKKEYKKLEENSLLADQYFVILSGHGSGAVGDFLPDDDPKSALSIPKLGSALATANKELGQKIDVLGMESCMMSMAEVCYELKDYVEYLVGAEGFIKNTGWPYYRVLEAVAETVGTGKGPEFLAKAIVRNYTKFYRDYELAGVSADLAAVKLGEFGQVEEDLERSVAELNLATLIKYLASKLTPVLKEQLTVSEELDELSGSENNEYPEARSIRDAIVLAHWYAQSYKREQYVDLYDFCAQLSRFLNMNRPDREQENQHGKIIEEVRDCCEAIKGKIEKVVCLSCYCGSKFQHSHGLSIYFPWTASRYKPEYRNLLFAKHTGWDEFLEAYLLATLRLRRCQESHMIDQKLETPERFGLPRSLAFLLSSAKRDSELGTDWDSELGTDWASKLGIASMKNPPDGFYRKKCWEVLEKIKK